MIRNWIKLLGQEHIDIKLNTSKDFETKILERPGLWMKPAELEQLRSDLTKIALKTLSANMLDYGVFSKSGDALKTSIVTVVYEKSSGKPVAFNALALMEVELGDKPVDVLHLGLVMIDPDVRSQGLSWVLYGLTCVFLFLRNQLRPIWVSNVTQVPAVVGMVSETFSEVYPNPANEDRQSLTHLLLSRKIMENHRHVFGVGPDAGFDEKRSVITNAYTGGSDNLKKTFDEAAKHREAMYNTFCQTTLNYKRGDDVIQLGKIDLNATRKFLANSVPRKSLTGLAIAGLWIVLNRLMLPVWYWFDNSREWNSLRAYK